MSDALAALRTHLLADTSVTALCSTRIYFDDLPQSAVLPAVVVDLDHSEEGDRRLATAGSLYRSSLNAYCYATTRTSANALAAAVDTACQVFTTGTWGAVTVTSSRVMGVTDVTDSPRDGSAAFRFIRALSIAVWHR